MIEAMQGVFITNSSPKHCPGCGLRIAYNEKPTPEGHTRTRLKRDWLIVCPLSPKALAAADPSLPKIGHNYHVRSGKPRVVATAPAANGQPPQTAD